MVALTAGAMEEGAEVAGTDLSVIPAYAGMTEFKYKVNCYPLALNRPKVPVDIE